MIAEHELIQARYIFQGDVVGFRPVGVDPQLPSLVLLVVDFAVNGEDVLVGGLDVLGRYENVHLWVDTEVEMRERGWIEREAVAAPV